MNEIQFGLVLQNKIGCQLNTSKVPCPCCKKITLQSRDEYEICSMCGWEDEPVVKGEYSYANKSTIHEYRVNYGFIH